VAAKKQFVRSAPENRSNTVADFRAFDPFSQPDSRFRQNVCESGTENRVPKYVWVSDSGQGITYRSFFGDGKKRLGSQENDPDFWITGRPKVRRQ